MERLELVYTDLQGPVTSTSFEGKVYIAKYTDHLSRVEKAYFLKWKSEAGDALIKFVQNITIPSGLRPQCLRSDSGGEYTGRDFCEYWNSTGIQQEFTGPYTPQQNGVAEREWQSLMAMTRCLLSGASLPKEFWAEVFNTLVYLSNRFPSSALGGKPPTLCCTGARLHPFNTFESSVHTPLPTKKMDRES
ncbi:unnamed protein product [Discosporangium mesarthrocarpum]